MECSQVLAPEEWLSAARANLGTDDCEVLKVSVDNLEGGVGGFLGEHLQVTMLVKTGGKEKELDFFVKRIPKNTGAFHTELVNSSRSFPKETGLYSRLFSQYPESNTPWCPRCYFAKPDTLVLEDLIKKKYRLAGRREHLDYPHSSLLLRALAALHAGSIIVEHKEGRKLNEVYADILLENIFLETTNINKFFPATVKTLVSCLSLVEKYNPNVDVNKVDREEFEKFVWTMCDLVKPSEKYRNVASHGDIWINNFLYKYDGDTPSEVRLLDFQLARYSPPAVDLLSFFHLNTSREFRAANTDKLLALYHSSLGEELARYGYRVEDHLPWDELQETYEVYQAVGCIIAASYHHFNGMSEQVLSQCVTAEGFANFFAGNRYELVKQCCEVDHAYRDRVMDGFEELVELFLAKQSARSGDSRK